MESTNRRDREEVDSVKVVEYDLQEYSAISLLGKKLYPPVLNKRTKTRREADLTKASENFSSRPDSLDYIIWYGRRLAFLYMYKEAIQIFTNGLERYPLSFELYRHRGHRFLTLRQFDNAVADLEKAAFYVRKSPIKWERNGFGSQIPRSTVQFNIWYHLGLTYYLKGNYDKAVSAYKKCLDLANNDDMLVSASDWLYMTYQRLGSIDAAEELLEPIQRHMNVIENKSYHRRLLMYKGILRPKELFDINKTNKYSIDDLTYGYGVGNWYFYKGDTKKAFQIFTKMLESPNWQAFGYLAAEVELANQIDATRP
ncbi:tetratricopeptide repeat protein [Reichenbachiella versicolor]|uniref:tetratricopeptide repeat protein n=1 Tax=Reichenbachiella versicolor TaxID=1821036 RepID=UPI0013A53033|nr:tetratricopeptide repeat protein [Reichenbachiella versicolor]